MHRYTLVKMGSQYAPPTCRPIYVLMEPIPLFSLTTLTISEGMGMVLFTITYKKDTENEVCSIMIHSILFDPIFINTNIKLIYEC